jgi:predicted RecB family nuclease
VTTFRAVRLVATSFYERYHPTACDLRPYLRSKGVRQAEAGPYSRVLRRLGERHEDTYLRQLRRALDLGNGPHWVRERRTRWSLRLGRRTVYQGRLRSRATLAGELYDVVGEPDFLVPEDGSHIIRDAKLARSIGGKPAIALQLQLYGWLYERVTGRAPAALEVYAGTGEMLPVAYDGGTAALAELEQIVLLKNSGEAPISPVGWSKCSPCGFRPHCWPLAEARQDVALLPGVDQALARALYVQGVVSIPQLLERYGSDELAEVEKQVANQRRTVGHGAAESILRTAAASRSGHSIVIAEPRLPSTQNYVMFDLEGLPPQIDEVEKVYLWGLQVFGAEPGDFLAATSDFGPNGDRHGWEAFLELADRIFDRHGDIPFVHWASYERSKLEAYVRRYGDPNGVAERVGHNLFDLLPVVRASVALPLPSYSLKLVERHVGFQRVLEEKRGDWAMAQYIEAVEEADPKARQKVMEEILQYNQEDLAATWAVMEWLRGLSPSD